MRLRLTQNGQFHLIHNFSHLLQPKCLTFGEISKIFIWRGGTSANFLNFSTFSNCFTLKWLKMTHNGKFCHQSGSDWLKMVNFGQFSTFSRFFLKKRLRLPGNWPIFLDLQLFKLFPTKVAQNDPQWPILPPNRGILTDLHRTFRTGLVKMSPTSAML